MGISGNPNGNGTDFAVASKHPFYLEKMDVSLPHMSQLEETRKVQKLSKSFGKKFPGLMELLAGKEGDGGSNIVVDHKTIATLHKFIKEVRAIPSFSGTQIQDLEKRPAEYHSGRSSKVDDEKDRSRL